MIPVRISSKAPASIAGRVGETDDIGEYVVTVWIDGPGQVGKLPYVVERQYIKRVPWPIRVAAHLLAQV